MSGLVGKSIKRVEDPRFIQGKGKYVANLQIPGMLHAAIVRSPHAHANIKGIDASAALALGGRMAALAALRLLKADPSFRQRLRANVKQMRSGLRELGFELPDNPVPIVTLRDDGRDLAALAAALAERDILVKLTPASGYSDAPPMPTLRIAVFSEHSPEQIDRLIRSVAELA